MDYKSVYFTWSYLKTIEGLEVVYYVKSIPVLHESLILLGEWGFPGYADIQTVKVAKTASQGDGDKIPVTVSIR